MADSTLTRKVKELKKTADPKAPIILIKADEKAKYKNLVDIIDEMAICTIANYAVVDISDLEKQMINGTVVSVPAVK
jgi:biopolymer transport protein ExbD